MLTSSSPRELNLEVRGGGGEKELFVLKGGMHVQIFSTMGQWETEAPPPAMPQACNISKMNLHKELAAAVSLQVPVVIMRYRECDVWTATRN